MADDTGKALSLLEILGIVIVIVLLGSSLAGLGKWLSGFVDSLNQLLGGDKVAQHDPNKPGIPIGLGGGVGETAPVGRTNGDPDALKATFGNAGSSNAGSSTSQAQDSLDEFQAAADQLGNAAL